MAMAMRLAAMLALLALAGAAKQHYNINEPVPLYANKVRPVIHPGWQSTGRRISLLTPTPTHPSLPSFPGRAS